MSITFHKIKRENVFCADFENMQRNNTIGFSSCGIAIIYGPNGIGKTSLTKAFINEESSECVFSIDDQIANNQNKATFHIIEDQNGRNIISGSTEDFVLGDNIKREYELKKLIDLDFANIFSSRLIPELKRTFGISTKNSNLYSKISNHSLRQFISDLANAKSKGKGIDRKEFINTIETMSSREISVYEDGKFNFMVSDYGGNKSVIEKILKLDSG